MTGHFRYPRRWPFATGALFRINYCATLEIRGFHFLHLVRLLWIFGGPGL
jgi:hypothetical protein